MGWESPGGTTHFAPPTYHYEPAYSPVIASPPNGVSSLDPLVAPHCAQGVGLEGGGRPPPHQHTVHFHVQPGEAVSLQLGEQVQTIQVGKSQL